MQKQKIQVSVAVTKQLISAFHFETLPMQYTETFSAENFENFIGKILIFQIFLLKTLIVGTH